MPFRLASSPDPGRSLAGRSSFVGRPGRLSGCGEGRGGDPDGEEAVPRVDRADPARSLRRTSATNRPAR